MKFVYLKLEFQKVFKNRDDNDSKLHFSNAFLIVSCNLEANLEERKKKEREKKIPAGLVRVTLTSQSHWCQ